MRNNHHLELHHIGTRTMLALAPRGVAIGTDELHIGIGGAVYDTYGRSVLLSRAQVEDLPVINLATTSMQFFLADSQEATR